MKSRSRFLNLLLPPLVFALFWGVIFLRAQPAWFRGSYTTEGGVWLSQMWQLGFLKSITTIRPDYCVLGNLVVLQSSDWINALLHGANLDHAPSIQHHVACIYAALMFAIVFVVLRRSQDFWPALLICGAMLLMPDLDDENRIFGEATNLGYFSALVTLFIYHDLWLNRICSKRRLVIYMILVMFHIATSPLAGMIAVAFVGAMCLRDFVEWLRARQALKLRLSLLLPHLIPVVFSVFTIIRAQQNSLYAHQKADLVQLKSRFTEVVFCRQMLYPLVLNFYNWFTDERTFLCLGVFLIVIGAYVLAEWKLRRPFDTPRITGMLLIFGAAFGMSAATVFSRQWLILRDESYDSIWPARYYIAQNMVMGAFIAILLVRVTTLFPKLKTGMLIFASLMFANYAVLQKEKIAFYLQQNDPTIVSRHWPYQLRRVHAIQSLTGDREAALKAKAPSFYTVEINIENHSMQVASDKMEQATATKISVPSDECAVEMADVARFKMDEDIRSRELNTQNFRVITRHDGVLATFDLLLKDIPFFSHKRKKLWLGSIPGEVQMRCFAYEIPNTSDGSAPRRSAKPSYNWLFKVCLFIKDGRTQNVLQQQLSGLPCGLGESANKIIAAGTLMQPHERLSLSALLGDESFAARLHPMKEVYKWKWNPTDVKTHKLSLKNEKEIVIPATSESEFDENAFLRYNPDIAGAVERKIVASGRAYYEEFGRKEIRQICRRSITVDTSKHTLNTGSIDGIRVSLTKSRKLLPPVVNCILHGDDGQSTELRLRPSDGGYDYSVYFIPASFKPAPHHVKSIEIEFEEIPTERTFQLNEIILFQSS
ncbi:MAG: hypothetical protein WCN98_07245 [Verrucomicrobiaceae bacterium]